MSQNNLPNLSGYHKMIFWASIKILKAIHSLDSFQIIENADSF